MVLAHGHYVEYARAESGPIFNFYLGKNTPACVAVANSENEQTEPSHMEADATVQHTSARRRPERKDYIMDKLVPPAVACFEMSLTFQLCPECLAKFQALQFNPAARQAANQIPFNSIIWSDEYPPVEQLPSSMNQPECFQSMVRLFAARKGLWQSGRIASDLIGFWAEARRTIPCWPGFRRLELSDEDVKALAACEEETDGIVEAMKRSASMSVSTDKGGGIVTIMAYPREGNSRCGPASESDAVTQ